MGSFSIWHWIIVLLILCIPLIFILRRAPEGPNRFGPEPGQPLDFKAAMISFFQNYANFSGRASRSAYWWPFLVIVGGSFVLQLVDRSGILEVIWHLATALPCFALAARRLHDLNRSGWFQLLSLFMPIGTIALVIWYATRPAETRALSNQPATG